MNLDRKRKTKAPCAHCMMHVDRCICEYIPRLDLKHRLCLVIHAKELKRTTNTGQLAIKSLVNSEIRVRGRDTESKQSLDLSDLLVPHYRTLLFYPSDQALDLTKDFVLADPRPIQLIVPDGNWRQASKVHYRHQELFDIPRVMIKKPNTATWHLRKETSLEGMSTLEAIAEAMGVIAGQDVKESLLKLYHMKLERTLIGRGVIQTK